MTSETFDQEALQVLRYFNAAASTIRLYPPSAPQVEKSTERAYQGMQLFVKKYKELSFGYDDDQPMLCSRVLFADSPERIREFPVLNHLKLTGLKNMLFKKHIRRSEFKQILQVFTTSVDEIKKAGGGLSFAYSLGVGDFFPDKLETPKHIQAELEKEYERQKTAVIDVPPKYLHFLFGKIQDPQMEMKLKKLFATPEKAMAIITSAIAFILKNMQKEKGLLSTPLFPLTLSKIDHLLKSEKKQKVATMTASFLVRGLKVPALCVLLSQKFPGDFGNQIYSSLIRLLPNETFEGIVMLLQKQTEQIDKSPTGNKENLKLLLDSYIRLTGTSRGKQVLASERVGSLIKGSEEQRREARLQAGMEALLKGDGKQLRNKEFLKVLPAMMEKFIQEGKEENIDIIVGLADSSFLESKGAERTQVILGLSVVAEKLISLQRWQQVDKLIPHMLEWVHQSEMLDDIYETCARCLQTFAINGWSKGECEQADRISRAFFEIRIGKQEKPAEIVELVDKVQDRGFIRHLFINQLTTFLKNPQDKQAGLRLTSQGPAAGRALLHTLLDSEQTNDRFSILELLPEFQTQLSQIILEVINEPMPWYKRRNLINLLGETGDEAHVNVISSFLNHDDHRVQREAFSCIYKLSGSNKKKHLLSVLPLTGSAMRPQVVKALIPFADDEVATALIDLLANIYNLADQSMNELLENICEAFGRSLSLKAKESLQKLLNVRAKHVAGYKKDVVYRAAAIALKQIQDHEQKIKDQKEKVKKIRKDAARKAAMIKTKAVIEKKKVTASADDIQRIEQFISEGKTEQAKQLLLDTIVKLAKAKQFNKAEKLRQRLIEVDPMALQDIIKAAELIEEEKSGSIDTQQLQVWSKLRESLTTEEFNHLYCSMDKITYNNGDRIVEQGEKRPCLYFINKGKVKLFYRDDSDSKGEELKGEELIKVLESGHIFGAEAFFTISVWTMGAMALSDTELSVLSLSDLTNLQDDFPGLESKLGDFCKKYESIDGFFSNSLRERREHKRYDIGGVARMVMLDDKGNATEHKVRGEFADVSLGGTIFYSRISRKEIAQKMLGRSISVAMPLDASSEETVQVKGVIIAVRGHNIMENEYSIHIRFNISLDDEILQKIVKAGQKHG